jgi:hypothetical protein
LNDNNDAYQRRNIALAMSNMTWFLAVISLFILFFIGGPSYYSSPAFKELWNMGHILFFTLTTYKIISLIKHKTAFIILVSSLIYCFTLGTLIELVQSKIGRSLDWQDIYRDALGTFLALSIYAYQKICVEKGIFLASRYFIIASLLIIIDQNTLFQTIKIDIAARSKFPILASFESKLALKQWSGNNLSLSNKKNLTGLYSLKVELGTETKYSEVTLMHMPRNWEGYNDLIINIYNPAEGALKITTKITDYQHDLSEQAYNDRYNKSFILLASQWNIIKISLEDIKNSPETRELKLDNISRLSLFTTDLTEDKVIYIDSVTLI